MRVSITRHTRSTTNARSTTANVRCDGRLEINCTHGCGCSTICTRISWYTRDIFIVTTMRPVLIVISNLYAAGTATTANSTNACTGTTAAMAAPSANAWIVLVS